MIYRKLVTMKTRLLICALALSTLCTHAADLVFHFNFKDADGKMEIYDSTGRFKCFSKINPFLVQGGALRSDYGAEIVIPAEKLPPELASGFTISLWSSRLPTILAQDRIPIISKGNLWLESDFAFVLNGQMPIFTFKSGNEHLQGVNTIGMSYGDSFRYADPSITVHTKESLRLPANKWLHLSITYDGKSLKFYKNGDLFIEKAMKTAKHISLTGNHPIYLGSDRLGDEFYTASNMLLNDIRLYKGVLAPEELKKQYETDRHSYPDSANYPATTHYYSGTSYEGFDPDLKKLLKRTERYEKAVCPILKEEKVTRTSTEFRNGRMNFNINGESIYPLSGYPGVGWFGKQAVDQSVEYIRDFAAAGVDLEIAGGGNISKYWLGENSYDWSSVDSGFYSILKANPKLKLFVVISCYLPEWFIKAHPEELEKYYSTRDSKAPLAIWTGSLIASELWQKTLDNYIEAAIKHYENSVYGNKIAGYLIVGGDAGEFYWPGTFTGGATGYSDNTRKEFRKWLAAKYHNDTALQAAWGKKESTLSSAAVPTPEERFNQSEILFRDFHAAHSVIDFREFLGDATLSAIKRILNNIKSASNGERVLMLYGGYPILFAGKGHTLQQSGMQTTARLMQEKNLSVLFTPIDYVNRRGGEPGININPYNGSARLHKKMLFNENDLRTHFYTMNTFGRTANSEESIGVIKRGIGHTITRGEGLEFMAMAGNSSYHQDAMMDVIAKGAEIGREAVSLDNSSTAQAAFFFDEDSLGHLAIGMDSFIDKLCWGTYSNSFKMGAPSDFYLMSDIANPKLPDYKLYIFINVFSPDSKMVEAINAKVRKNNAVAVWCYAPGYIGKDGYSTAAMESITGMKFGILPDTRQYTLQITDPENPITKEAASTKFETFTFSPSFHPVDTDIKTLGTASGRPALAIKEFKDWSSVYSLMPLTPELLRGLCDYAQVHVYNRTNDIFGANASFLQIHAVTPGDKVLKLPGKYKVIEAYSNEFIGNGVSSFTAKGMKKGETRLYKLYK